MKSRKFSAYIRPVMITLFSIVLIIATGLTGCQLSSISKTEQPATPPANSETEGKTDLNDTDVENKGENVTPTLPPAVVYYNVLTGLKTTSELAALRPVSVCIENTPYSLPQYGVSDAQVLIEAPVAGGGTKLMMLTTDYRYMTTIGAVTSTRPYLAELGDMFDSIHCFNGTDGTMTDELLAEYDTLNAENTLLNGIYYKDETRFDIDDRMTNGILLDSGIRRAELDEKLSNGSIPYTFVKDGTEMTPDGIRALEATIRYSDNENAQFTYNSETKMYERAQFGTTTLDGTNGEKVSFKNVMILYASSTTYESKDSKSMDFIFTDGGSGTYISNGQAVTFLWHVDENGDLHFTDASGAALEINRGTSYIGILPVGDMDSVYIK